MFGGKGRRHRAYSAPLFERLNTRCQQLFGETVEENIYAPANVTSNELLGLEYLFSQSTGESGPFSLSDISEDGPSPEEEVIQAGQSDPDEDDEANQSDPEADNDIVPAIPAHITLTTDETTAAHSPAFVRNLVFTRSVTVLGKKSNRTVLHQRFGMHLHRGSVQNLDLTTHL